jgi:hypothetical protein
MPRSKVDKNQVSKTGVKAKVVHDITGDFGTILYECGCAFCDKNLRWVLDKEIDGVQVAKCCGRVYHMYTETVSVHLLKPGEK